MQYKVPQNVQREDTILWFITLRQLILLLGGGGISYTLFVQLSKVYDLSGVETILILIPFALSAAFAFLRIKCMSLMEFILVCIEQFAFRAPRRFWSQEGNILISMTTQVKSNKVTQAPREIKKALSAEKINHLTDLLDGEKSKQKILLQKS